ncbi:MAG: helix-turn-helix domain-containing protein [Clostridia bacterium]|nr:helix-turn-helix domain-containing protein [Clostridia bacterium]
MESIEAIKNYYEYLENTTGLSISVHYMPKSHDNVFFIQVLPIPKIHFNPYCTYIKQVLDLHPKCLECQMNSIEKCMGGNSFSKVCHAGVFEYVYPLKFGDRTVGALSISGYAAENFDEYAQKFHAENNVDKNEIIKFSSALKKDIPKKEEVDTLIVPLLCMIKNVSILTDKQVESKSLFPIHGIISFCERYYTRKISIDYLSERFFCSKSYIARTFKKETGKSLPEYINHLRIKNAMQLLKSTNADISQIGATVGYDDPSYFTKCFVKIAGVTPKKWRNLNKPQE